MSVLYDVVVRPEVHVIIEEEHGAWGAYVPSIPGCIAAGTSRDEVEHRIEEALTAHLVLLHADGLREEAEAEAAESSVSSA